MVESTLRVLLLAGTPEMNEAWLGELAAAGFAVQADQGQPADLLKADCGAGYDLIVAEPGTPAGAAQAAPLVRAGRGELAGAVQGVLIRSAHLNRFFSVLSKLTHAISSSGDDLLQEVCRIAVTAGGYGTAWVGLADQATRTVQPVAYFGAEERELLDLQVTSDDVPLGAGPTGRAVREGRPVIINDIARDDTVAIWHETAARHGYHSAASFPLQVHGRMFGALTLYSQQVGAFTAGDVQLLVEVASHVGFALESMDREAARRKAEFERSRLSISEQAARAQARAEARFRELLEAAPDAILEIDRSGRILLMNAAAEELFGYTREELTGLAVEILVPEALRELHRAHREAYFSRTAGVVHRREVSARRKDGSEFPAEVSLSPVKSESSELVTCVLRDITHRKQAEHALNESSRQMAAILETITDGFCAFDREWRVSYLNNRAEQITGRKRDDLLGRIVWEEFPTLVGTELYNRLQTCLAEMTPLEFTGSFGPIWIEVHAYPSENGLSVYFEDITARKQLEEQFRQSQKLEALGRLAGGVAHDFNNLLTIIGGYGQMLLESAEKADPIRRDLEAIVEAANRASALTKQLLAFSRRQMVQPKVLDLNRVVAKMDKMLRRLIGEDIQLALQLEGGLGRVKVDPSQVEQVLLNLVVNARDAMPRGGKLTVRTSEAEVAGGQAGGPEVPPGRYVVLSVGDTGTGMSAAVLSRMFEPFFTTKPKGKGTGLGLATVYGIVKQAGGDIVVETEEGKGSTFRIFLPRLEEAPKLSRRHREKTAPGGETILLAEDDTEVRRLTREMLASQGYTVIEARHGAEALRMCQENRGKLHLLITDIIMPHMSGVELARAVAAVDPELRVLYISGYTDDVIASHGEIDRSTDLLQKPFTRDMLAARVRKMLDRKPASRE